MLSAVQNLNGNYNINASRVTNIIFNAYESDCVREHSTDTTYSYTPSDRARGASCLARRFSGVTLRFVVLVAVPSVVALLLVHLVCAVGVGLAVEHGGAGCAALVVFARGIAAAPVVRVDLHHAVIGGAVDVFVRGSAVVRRLILRDAHHGADSVGWKTSFP